MIPIKIITKYLNQLIDHKVSKTLLTKDILIVTDKTVSKMVQSIIKTNKI